jgi:hypothetical protein
MFKALLDWLRPTDNNAQLSNKFKKVLQRIIDTVFDSLEPLQYGAQTQQRLNEQQQLHRHDQQSPGQNLSSTTVDAEHDLEVDPALVAISDMDWLNTIDWTQGGWLEQSNQPFLH